MAVDTFIFNRFRCGRLIQRASRFESNALTGLPTPPNEEQDISNQFNALGCSDFDFSLPLGFPRPTN